MVERCTQTALSGDNSRDPTVFYLPKQQPLSESFPNALRTLQSIRKSEKLFSATCPCIVVASKPDMSSLPPVGQSVFSRRKF